MPRINPLSMTRESSPNASTTHAINLLAESHRMTLSVHRLVHIPCTMERESYSSNGKIHISYCPRRIVLHAVARFTAAKRRFAAENHTSLSQFECGKVGSSMKHILKHSYSFPQFLEQSRAQEAQ